ncbi:MAG: sulfatase-like hydrolase/transferase [Puniceicoccales bacterium]|jgi:phosphoglycerol transferase MdoB-like AlkP superfamily enzyme|nr:sulfatase-like hydrolase/transferase [Puniceicoccales bacterium]
MQQKNNQRKYWKTLLCKFGTLLVIFFGVRFLFFCSNYKIFASEPPWLIFKAFVAGMRFDLATIAIFNIPVWGFWSLTLRLRSWKFFNAIATGWFLLANFLALLVNIIDVKYFSFTFKRMSGEIFEQSVLLAEDPSIYVHMLAEYWYIVVSGLVLVCALVLAALKFSLTNKTDEIRKRDFAYSFASIILLIVCVRGGLQRKPLKPVDANIYAPNIRMVCLVNNSAFNIFHTRKKANLPPHDYFANDDDRLLKISPRHRPGKFCDTCTDFQGKNVFIIILESFSAEYVGALDGEFKEISDMTFTPFLDSLIGKSYIFDGFANGTTSIDGLTSIILSIPPLFDAPYIISAYGENTVNSSASILKKDGYKTLFFYGGKGNSCNFGSLGNRAQFDEYYCQYDYDGPSSDINGWGVYDEEFFQFVARKVDKTKSPFFSVLFSLSSHHPFLYPKRLHGKFPKGIEKLQELMAYTDYSLQKFFETAEQMDWYRDTLFVLIADHIASPRQRYYQNTLGGYSIPIIFFDPNGRLVGKSNEVAQQIDIMPSILDLVGSKRNYFSFGSSLFDQNAPRFAISHKDGIYQLITKDFVCKFDGKDVIGLYRRSDFFLENNLVEDPKYLVKKENLQNFTKAFLQQYGKSIKNNAMTVAD